MDAADVQVLFAARLPRQLGSVDKYYNEYWALHAVLDTQAALRIGSQSWALSGSWIWGGYPGPRITFAPSGRLPRLHWRISLSGAGLRRWRAEGLWPDGPLSIRDAAAFQVYADRVLTCLDGDDALAGRRRANAVEALLLEVQRQQQLGPALPTWILDVQRRLQTSWRETPDYAALARRYHMPLSTLRKSFRRHCGEAIHTWFLRQRHREAERLLLDSDASLGEIAERCGYSDQAWFSRQFTRFAGISPLRFRRASYG